MKKKSVFLLSVLLLTLAGCSSDDESELDGYNYVQEFRDENSKDNFIGTWHVLHYGNGWGLSEEYEAGAITVTFTIDGEMKVVNKKEDNRPFPTGTSTYSFVQIDKSIFTGKPRTTISFNNNRFFLYSYTFDKGYLYLSQEAYDGDGYTLRKLK